MNHDDDDMTKMSHSTPTDETIDAVLSGQPVVGSAGLIELITVMRTAFIDDRLPEVGAALSEFVKLESDPASVTTTGAGAAGLLHLVGTPSEGNPQPSDATHASGARKRLSLVGTFVGTFTGKIILGAALAAAAAGGAQSLGVIHLPTFSPDKRPPTVIIPQGPRRDPGVRTSDNTDLRNPDGQPIPVVPVDGPPGTLADSNQTGPDGSGAARPSGSIKPTADFDSSGVGGSQGHTPSNSPFGDSNGANGPTNETTSTTATTTTQTPAVGDLGPPPAGTTMPPSSSETPADTTTPTSAPSTDSSQDASSSATPDMNP